MPAWYQYPITQAHGENGEQGVDFGVPFHTPLTPILGGRVQRVDCTSGWRCEVDIATQYQGKSFVESFLHVDQPMVSAGQNVSVNSVIGLSGGQLQGGSNPDSPQFSTGPHTEFDMFQGSTPWRNAIDPTSLARGGPQGNTGCDFPLIGGIMCASASAEQNVATVPADVVGALGNIGSGLGNLAQAFDPAHALNSLSGAVTGTPNIHDFLLRAALVLGGIFLLGLGLYALLKDEADRELSSPVGRQATQDATEAAVAA